MRAEDTAFPRETTPQWWDENWYCVRDTGGYGEPQVANFYSFLKPTHAIIFLDPYGDISRLYLHQFNPVPSRRRQPWILPGETEARFTQLPRSEWKDRP